MAEAPPSVNLGPDRPVVIPATGRFMPHLGGEPPVPAPAGSPTQPRSAGALVPPDASDQARHVSDIVSAVPPPAEGSDPKFIPVGASAPDPNTIEGSTGQRFQAEDVPSLAQRLLGLFGRGKRQST